MAADAGGGGACEGEAEAKDVAGQEVAQCDQVLAPTDKGLPRMTPRVLSECCVQNRGFSAPELNEVLILHYKGFRKIEGLGAYRNVKSLFLECNGINKIENLEGMPGLVSLYLQSNCIKRIENLEGLRMLQYLNLSNNNISCIENLAPLESLETLKVASNKIVDVGALEGLAQRPTLLSVDVAYNYIEDADGLIGFWAKTLPDIQCVYLHHNSCSREAKDLRRRLVSSLRKLRWIDERPVTELERVGCEAWAWGGKDAELKAKQAHYQRELKAKEKSFYDHRRIQEAAAERARARREAQAARDTARAQAAAGLSSTGVLEEGWLSVDAGPSPQPPPGAGDSARHAELHAKVKAFLAKQGGGHADDTSGGPPGSGVAPPGEPGGPPVAAFTPPDAQRPGPVEDTVCGQTDTHEVSVAAAVVPEHLCLQDAGLADDAVGASTGAKGVLGSTVAPARARGGAGPPGTAQPGGAGVAGDAEDRGRVPAPSASSTASFAWTGFRDKRLGRLVAEFRYDFSRAAAALSEEFDTPVSVAECRQRYRDLCKPSSGRPPGGAGGGSCQKWLHEQRRSAKDAPPVSAAAVKEVSDWWLQKMLRKPTAEPAPAAAPPAPAAPEQGTAADGAVACVDIGAGVAAAVAAASAPAAPEQDTTSREAAAAPPAPATLEQGTATDEAAACIGMGAASARERAPDECTGAPGGAGRGCGATDTSAAGSLATPGTNKAAAMLFSPPARLNPGKPSTSTELSELD